MGGRGGKAGRQQTAAERAPWHCAFLLGGPLRLGVFNVMRSGENKR